MKFTIDLDTLAFTEVSKTVKRGDAAPFEVTFTRASIAEELATGSVITFSAKEINEYNGPSIVLFTEFERTETGTDPKYLGSPSFNTEALDALFVPEEESEDAIDYVDLIAEFSWRVGSGLPASSKTFFLRVDQRIHQGDEGTPTELPTPDDDWIAHGHAQSLTAGQRLQARQNIGSEHLTRTTAEGPPVVYPDLIIGGTGSPAAPDETMVFHSIQNDKPRWQTGVDVPLAYVNWQPDISGSWQYTVLDGFSSIVYAAEKTSTADSPVGLTDWTVGVGTGSPTFTEDSAATVPDHIGQWCRVGDDAPYDWYQAVSLTSWVFRFTDGESGGSEETAATISEKIGDFTSAQAAVARTGMETSQNNKHLRGLGNLVKQASTSEDFPVSIITIGDSYAAFASFRDLQRGAKIAGSYRCGAVTGGGDTLVTTTVGDTRSPDGVLKQVASGGILSCGHLESSIAGPADRAYYTFFTGTGTAQFQYSDNGGGWTAFGSPINTAGIGTVSIGSVALPSHMSQARVRIVVTVGTVNGWIGQGVDGPGITQINFATSGMGIEQITCGETIWKAMIGGYKPTTGGQLVYCIFADVRFTAVSTTPWPIKGTPSWDASGPAQTLYNWSRAQNATVDWMVVGPHTVDPAHVDLSDALVDAAFATIGIGLNTNDRLRDGTIAQRDFAVRNSIGFVECIDLFPDYTKANAEGFYGDDVHLSEKGDAVKRSFVLTNSNMGWLFGNEGYRSAIRMGNVLLSADTQRGHGASIVALGTNGLAPAGFVGNLFRAGLSTRFQTEGTAFWTFSSNVMHLGVFGPSSKTGLLAVDPNGSYPVSTAGTYTSGTIANPWGCVFTNGFKSSYALKTADYTIVRNTSTDYLIHYKTGPFTVTLPLAFDGEKTGVAGRTFIIKNSSASNITVATLSDGSNLQKIDNATTATVAPGATLRVMSAQVSGFASADYGNWISF